ncbi:hypothetical protein E2C01_013848 [Portunus trituberculatus]|uniref:Secreted protein n=1 Tax=Portunus trituberculatus TaxID=210409 RepID=A0A5B7DII6_PORTR|nr:hypothetical protein [Portunus trituberculatus]
MPDQLLLLLLASLSSPHTHTLWLILSTWFLIHRATQQQQQQCLGVASQQHQNKTALIKKILKGSRPPQPWPAKLR